jgi:hypothetical protein
MKKLSLFLTLGLLLASLARAHETYKLEKNDTIEQVFKFSSAQKQKIVKIDNVFGSITVGGASGAEVRLKAKKSLRADSESDLLKAEREVKLDMAEKDGQLDIYVDGPFRCRDGSVNWSDPDYTVTYDFDLQVPQQTDLILKTVNDGDIVVKNVSGAFSVRNVNGRIELEDIAGSGSCKTVNGNIRTAFRENPASACSFITVNGDLDVRFNPDLAADFQLKTFNGEIYSDYPVTYASSTAAIVSRACAWAVADPRSPWIR